ncbi:cadherin-like beta sandwich domain-containing protein [Cohnella sp. CFH 77786]|uniref:cadherin-like beta sandwich domain-containing protein n=1 Tax=Cohnella sp. CFH 77786 TaxID=2662265 RepID=UPI0021042DE2|nr:cadherin-like beta sandwich domain-containing protein [Cohnella sp. CFH 77786]
MLRKGLMPFLAVLIALSPFLGLFSGHASAATSRVAVIKSLTGTVQVKKAGGSKQFKAFARMSLNEGDILTTSASSTAVLQFANGTSEDDKMSVAANTTLTFSKLSDRKGTRTKVSMFNGAAWVDVKSIASKNDEFTLETPTAIMGVRGTHLLVSVDPVSGSTRLTVAAGVVSTQTTDQENPDNRDVYPTQNALVSEDSLGDKEITIAPVDLEMLMKQSDKSIVEAIVRASGEIVKENKEKLGQYLEQSGTQGTDELARQKSNVENLLGAIVDNAVKAGLISQDRVNQLVSEAQTQTGVVIDLSKKELQLTDEEKRKQAEQQLKEEEARKSAEEQKKKEAEQRAKNEDLFKRLEAERKAQEEANRKALEEKNKKALIDYESQLSDADKARFQEDNKKLSETAGSGSGNGGSGNGGSSNGGSGNGGSGSSSQTPSFISSWATTDGSGNPIQWTKMNLPDPEPSATSSHEFLLANVTEDVQDIYMRLNFDQTKYTARVYSLYKGMSLSSQATRQLNSGYSVSQPALDLMSNALTVNSVSGTSSGWYFPFMEVATWKTSGSTDTVPLPVNGPNLYALVLIPNSVDGTSIPQIAFLSVQKAVLPFHLGWYAGGNTPIVQTGPSNFVTNLNDTVSEAGIFASSLYGNYLLPMKWSVTGDNGSILSDVSQYDYNKNFLLKWNSDEKPGMTNINFHLEDTLPDVNAQWKEDYQLAVYKGNTDNLKLAGFEVKYTDNPVDYDASVVQYFEDDIADPKISTLSITPKAMQGHSLSDYDIKIYRNGTLIADPSHARVGAGANVYDVVVRPSNGNSTSPLNVYRIVMNREYATPQLTDLKVNNVSIYSAATDTFETHVPAEMSTARMNFTTNDVQGKWIVYNSNGEKLDASGTNQYDLDLQQGSNKFIVYNTSSSYSPGRSLSLVEGSTEIYGGYYEVYIYKGVSAELQSLSTTGFEITGFKPDVETYSATVTGATYYVSVKPFAADNTASITVNGVSVANNTESGPIHVNVGSENIITIHVSAVDGKEMTYSIQMIREASGANGSEVDGIWFSEVPDYGFSPSVMNYTFTDVTATELRLRVDPAFANSPISVEYDDQIVSASISGEYTLPLTTTVHKLEVTVYSSDWSKHVTYYYTIDRRGFLGAAGDATLSEISGTVSSSPDLFNFDFSPIVLNYWYRVSASDQTIVFKPVAAHGTVIKVTNGSTDYTGTRDSSGNFTVPLNYGNNAVKVIVESQDHKTLEYTFMIFRPTLPT